MATGRRGSSRGPDGCGGEEGRGARRNAVVVWGLGGEGSEEEEASLIIKGGEGGLAGWRRLRDGRPGSPHYGRCLFLEEKEGGPGGALFLLSWRKG